MMEHGLITFAAVGVVIAAIAASIVSFICRCSSNHARVVSTTTTIMSKDIDTADRYPNGKLLICFGSQTGTAEQYAKTLLQDARREGYDGKVLDLEDFEDAQSLESTSLTVWAMATYGEGEPTDNAHEFVKWAKTCAKEGDPVLANVRFAVFGLGNTQYQHFNAMGKLTDKLLEQLGGSRICPLGLGDDDKDLDADFDQWRVKLWTALGGGGAKANGVDLETDFHIKLEHESDDFASAASRAAAITADDAAASTRFYFTALRLKVVHCRELRSSLDSGSTKHVELETPQKQRSPFYATADNLGVLPENDPDDVEGVARCLGFPGAKAKTRLVLCTAKPPFPTPCTIETAIARYCDLTHKPKARQLEALLAVVHTNDRLAQLQAHLDDPKWLAQYPTLADLMLWLEGPLEPRESREHFLSVFFDKVVPRLQPRYYTICSSAASEPNCVHLASALVNLPGGRSGVCTRYLAKLRPGDTCAAFVRPSAFRPPPQPSAPLVLVGPGTGVAPCRAVIRDVAAKVWPRPANLSLYFGCKRPDLDHLYRDEMEAWVSDGHIDRLRLAYSRAQAHKVYVQHKLTEDARQLAADLIDRGGAIFVCGGTDMGNAVFDAVRNALAAHSFNGDFKSADEAVSELQRSGRYVQELWA